MARLRSWLKRWYRRVRNAAARRRLARHAGRGSIVAASTWDFPHPTHTFVQQDMLGLLGLGVDLWVVHGEAGAQQGLAARFAPLRRRGVLLETLAELHRADLEHLDRAYPGRVDALLARVARATHRGLWDLRREPLVLRAATFTRLVELAGARCIHSWFCYEMSFLAMFASQVLGLPRVLSCYVDHRLDDHPFKVVPLHLATADLVLATSEQARDELIAIGGAACASRILVKHIGVDASALRPLRALRPASSPFEILSVSRIEPKKGLHVLVEAAGLLVRRGRRIVVRLVGGEDAGHAASADYAAALRQRVQANGLRDVVLMPGMVGHDRLPELLGRACVFVAPYVELPSGDKDGIPTSVLEAMAAGLPIVASRAGAMHEAVADGEQGLLVPQHDPVALAAAIERLLDDEALRRRLGAEAARRFDREFDCEVTDRELHRRVRQWLAADRRA